MLQYDAITFDAGNTLVYLDHAYLAGLLEEYGVRLKPQALARAEQETRVEFDRADVIGSTTDAERWRAYVESMLAKAGLRDGPAFGKIYEALQRANRRRRLWSHVPPKVPRLLARLKKAGYRMAVVSNSDGRVREFLESADLVCYFERIVDSFDVKIEKPDPRIFDHALGPMGVKPHRAMHVGDYYHIDVVGAERAGMTGVLLDPLGLHRVGGVSRPRLRCPVIRKLEEVEELLDGRDPAPTRKAMKGAKSTKAGEGTSEEDDV